MDIAVYLEAVTAVVEMIDVELRDWGVMCKEVLIDMGRGSGE